MAGSVKASTWRLVVAGGRAVALMIVAVLMLLCLALTVARLDFPQFVAAFILGDMRMPLLWMSVAATMIAVVVWRTGAWSASFRRVAKGTTILSAVLALGCAWYMFRYYAVSEVMFTSHESGGAAINIGARLYTPRSSGRHAAVLLVPGSENVKGATYHSFADRFARAGYVVLVPDKRGVGRSGGVFQPPSPDSVRGRALLDTLAGDVVASMRFLRTVVGIDTNRVGFFGLSQAGWVIPLAERQITRAAFAVIVSGPAVSTHEEEVFSELSGERADHFAWKAPPIPFDSINALVEREPAAGYDPRAVLSQLQLPALWVYGGWDNSIPVEKSVHVLEQLRDNGHPFSVRTVAYGNHGLFVMRGPEKRRLPYYPDGLWSGMFAWIDSVTSRAN